MSERTRVEALLAAAARDVGYPPTPALRPRVVGTLARAGAGRTRATWSERASAPALIAAAVVLAAVALAAVAAIPPARTAVAEFFGLVRGERIERSAPSASPSPAAGSAGTLFRIDQYARPTTLAEATALLGFDPALPDGGEMPAGVFVVEYEDIPLLILQYDTFDLWQVRGDAFFFLKRLPADAVIETPDVRGRPAYWIESRAYEVRFFTAEGREALGARRSVDRQALIWRGAETFYRLETELPLARALAIAASLP